MGSTHEGYGSSGVAVGALFDNEQHQEPLSPTSVVEGLCSYQHQYLPPPPVKHQQGRFQNIAEISGTVLEWYCFALMGYFADVLADLFFPPDQRGHAALIESFAVFGSAFLMRPIGGIMVGYVGDTHGRKQALVLSLWLMAIPTVAMGLLPTYATVGAVSYTFLILIRLLQGVSAGGQLMSSLVFTLEQHPKLTWGFQGSLTMASANFGTFLSVTVNYGIRLLLSEKQLNNWGWRLPFLSGILIAPCALYLQWCSSDDHVNVSADKSTGLRVENPLCLSFARKNIRQLLAAVMIPMLWSGGFWFTFVWMAIYMLDLMDPPIKQAMGINSFALFLSVCLLFPVAGTLSDKLGRKRIMTIGAVSVAVMSPALVMTIGRHHSNSSHTWLIAFWCQFFTGICLSFWGAPMMAWMVESFDPESRLTSAEIGYNIGQALAGTATPAAATWIVDHFGCNMPGFWLTGLAIIALVGLWCVAPRMPPPIVDHDALTSAV